MIAALPAIVWQAPISFGVGLAVGFVLSGRYRIVKREEDEGGDAR